MYLYYMYSCINVYCTVYINLVLPLVHLWQYGNRLVIFTSTWKLPYSRVVTPPILKRNFALKRGGGNNENCIISALLRPRSLRSSIAVIVLY